MSQTGRVTLEEALDQLSPVAARDHVDVVLDTLVRGLVGGAGGTTS